MEETEITKPIFEYDYENPPATIFNQNLFPMLLPYGYIRCVLIPLLNKNYFPHVESIIYDVCCSFCSSLYIGLKLDKNINPKYAIHDIDEYAFKSIVLGNNTSIVGMLNILRITVKNNLKMDWNSIIKNDNNYGTIILTVYGDINMSKNTDIICENYGNIYISCNNLIMRKGSNILTCNNDKSQSDNDKLSKETHVFGNVYLNVNHSIIMDKICLIQSGNIKISCNSLKIRKKSRINALRNNLVINAKNGIEYDDENECDVFLAVNEKHINTDKNELQLDELLAPTNLTHDLSIFRETSEFECIICFDNEPNIMIQPCGHSSFCNPCIDSLGLTQCPICRTQIHSYYDFNKNQKHSAPKIEPKIETVNVNINNILNQFPEEWDESDDSDDDSYQSSSDTEESSSSD